MGAVPPLVRELRVQLPQLLEEAPVGQDPAARLDVLGGVGQRHAFADHQVGQEQRGRATPTHHAVH